MARETVTSPAALLHGDAIAHPATLDERGPFLFDGWSLVPVDTRQVATASSEVAELAPGHASD